MSMLQPQTKEKKMRRELLSVVFINNDGGGLADELEVDVGTTLQELLDEQLSSPLENYFIRVNKEPAVGSYVLQDNDKITATPTKIAGA